MIRNIHVHVFVPGLLLNTCTMYFLYNDTIYSDLNQQESFASNFNEILLNSHNPNVNDVHL